jgi:hypothetical protein
LRHKKKKKKPNRMPTWCNNNNSAISETIFVRVSIANGSTATDEALYYSVRLIHKRSHEPMPTAVCMCNTCMMLYAKRLHVACKLVMQNVTRIREVENLTHWPRIFWFILMRTVVAATRVVLFIESSIRRRERWNF